MRFKLTLSFNFKASGKSLPINYHYELASWIYKTLSKGDSEYSEWLHQNGYINDRKQFRMFTFSNLQISNLRINGDRLVLLSEQAILYLSFLPERATEEFIKGIFTTQTFKLGDWLSGVQCCVQSIEVIAQPAFSQTMTFQTLSPIVISGHLENGKPTYLSPEAPNAAQLLYNNLCAKYIAYYGKSYTEAFKPEFILTSPLKRKKITIKANTLQQTYVVGYMGRFSTKLPEELMLLMYETGVGEKGSLGFGMVEKID